MKKLIILFICAFCFQANAQDSIVNYLDFNGKSTKKSKAFSIETVVKKGATWEYTEYYRSGKIKEKGQYKKKNKTKPIGTFYEFFRNSSLKSFYSHNEDGELSGNTKMWFDNKSVSFIGNYKLGKKIGVWKYYHYNGQIACKQYFQNFKAVKTVFYDETGKKTESELIRFQKPKFEGGDFGKFWERIRKVHSKLGYQINGLIILNFDIDVNGKIVNFSTSDKIPKELERRLRIYFKNIEGWTPAIHMNRKIPYNYSIPLNFNTSYWNRADGE
ncbi:MAG: hypothetical protein JXR05_12760 [Flavobacteriaceae bacterium]